MKMGSSGFFRCVVWKKSAYVSQVFAASKQTTWSNNTNQHMKRKTRAALVIRRIYAKYMKVYGVNRGVEIFLLATT
jgi:hypothetical protein